MYGYFLLISNRWDPLKVRTSCSWVTNRQGNCSSSSWCGLEKRWRRLQWRNGNWSTLNVTWCCTRAAPAVMRAIIRPQPPYHGRLTQFILHSSASVPANRPCRDVVRSRATQRHEIYLATAFPHLVARLTQLRTASHTTTHIQVAIGELRDNRLNYTEG